MGFWSRLFKGSSKGDGVRGHAASTARWLEPGAPTNPFGVRLLDLMQNLRMVSTTTDPAIAARSVSWKPGMHRALEVEPLGVTHPCDLRYPAGPELPDGLLYRPTQMEDKWVIVYRDGRVAAARSWTGETVATARARHVGDQLLVTELTIDPDSSGLDAFGDPVQAFDWLIRSHALGARVPLPASAEGAERLANTPLMGFSLYGRQLFCAAVDYDLGDPKGQLTSDGDLVAAVAAGDAVALASVLSNGEPVNALTSFSQGGSALQLAVHLHPDLIGPLVEAGADVNVGNLRGSTPLMTAVATDADRTVLERLLHAGANLRLVDQLGFTALHVAAQFGRLEALKTLVHHGALPTATERDLTPVQIAVGNNRGAAVEWLLDHGEPQSPPALVELANIAETEGHTELARLLRQR